MKEKATARDTSNAESAKIWQRVEESAAHAPSWLLARLQAKQGSVIQSPPAPKAKGKK